MLICQRCGVSEAHADVQVRNDTRILCEYCMLTIEQTNKRVDEAVFQLVTEAEANHLRKLRLLNFTNYYDGHPIRYEKWDTSAKDVV